MIKRYANSEIERIFGDQNKTSLWQGLELMVIKAKVELKMILGVIYEKISSILQSKPVDLEWWKRKDEEIHHDLNAFVFERTRHLPGELQSYVHEKITSFDTEETPFMQMLREASVIVEGKYKVLEGTLVNFSKQNRYTVMIASTHGQEAEMKSLGARGLTWLADLRIAHEQFQFALKYTEFSKISGAVGNYGSISPEVEKKTLELLGFKPYYGATQILPRVIHAFLAEALCNMVMEMDKISNDIRLSARSGLPLLQEPFKKKQTGSSAMPHKKNPIQLEQIEGLARMAKGYMNMIIENIKTWEERAIEQSSVERVAWPDLFHVASRAFDVLEKVLSGITIYRDNMLQRVVESRGVYASSEVKEFLKGKLATKGLDYESCYRLVQLACFNVFEVDLQRQNIREHIPISFSEIDSFLPKAKTLLCNAKIVSIEELIPGGELKTSSQLAVVPDNVDFYNQLLKDLFKEPEVLSEWHKLFTPSYLLRNENILFEKILGV